jgi:hypothetical protein
MLHEVDKYLSGRSSACHSLRDGTPFVRWLVSPLSRRMIIGSLIAAPVPSV